MIFSLGQIGAIIAELKANKYIMDTFEIGDYDEVRTKLDTLTLDQKKHFWRAVFRKDYQDLDNILIELTFKKKL